MREIKFRGFYLPMGEITNATERRWIYGDLIHIGKDVWIKDNVNTYPVYPETVGQFTGLKDRNGMEIYEGDGVVKFFFKDERWAEKEVVAMEDYGWSPFYECDMDGDWSFCRPEECVVLGNIHENPELLK